ncbi:MAG: hypothetical protein CMG14_00460 [Candidatus Marinimicrobia bacterium]|nr:hypothetical protein [Candidatus Neomarinimicrobiota bacterium]|tara:strand:+ start:5191 stop:5964 length:774 start_codon:yes stop_codon:yes gene_type:complete
MVVKLYLIILTLLFSNCGTYIVSEDTSVNKIDFVKKLIDDEKYSRAIDELNYILFNDPLSEYSGLAQFYIAECYFYLDDYNQSIIEYNKYLTRNDSIDKLVKKSQFMLCRCYFNISLDYNKDQSDTYIAIEKLQYFIEKESMMDYLQEIEIMILDLRTKLAKKDFYTAKLYIKLEELDAAVIYYNNIINDYYDTEYVNSSITNIALILCADNIEKAQVYLDNNKDNFLNNIDYENVINLIQSLDKDKDESYYLSFLK